MEDVFIELLVVGDGEDHLVEPLQLLYVVLGDVSQLYPAPAGRTAGSSREIPSSDRLTSLSG